jgi:hypothetical protein
MAHQTSKKPRNQTTPPIIGRLMDADPFLNMRIFVQRAATGCNSRLSADHVKTYVSNNRGEAPGFRLTVNGRLSIGTGRFPQVQTHPQRTS